MVMLEICIDLLVHPLGMNKEQRSGAVDGRYRLRRQFFLC